MELRMEDLTRILGSPVNLQILSILSTRAMYPRELARLLGKDETDVSRRLKRLERLGLVTGEWKRIAGRNVRVYRAVSGELKIKFTPSGISIGFGGKSLELPPVIYGNQPPQFPEPPVGRDRELERLSSNRRPVVHVWGVSGTGKTHLVSFFLTKVNPGPVLWYRVSREDVKENLVSRIYLFVSALGYTVPGPPEYIDEEILAEALAATGVRLVVDDYHEALDEGLRVTVKRLAHLVRGRGVLYILSRRKARGLPLLEGRVLELRLGPLEFNGFYKLLSRRIQLEERVAREVYRVTGGIPILALAVASAVEERGLDPVEAAANAVRAYFSGRLAGVLSDEDLEVIEALAVAGIPLDTVVLSRVAGVGRLRARLDRLVESGILEVSAEGYRLHQAFMGYRRLIPRRRLEYLASRLGRILVEDPNEAYMVRGISLLAEACDPLIGEIAAGRIARGEFWSMKWARPYLEALRKAESRCTRMPPLERLYVKAEVVITEGVLGVLEPERVARELSVIAARISDASPHVASKLYSIASLYYSSLDMFDEAGRALEEAYRYAVEASGDEARKALITYYSNLAYMYSRMHRFMDMADAIDRMVDAYGEPGDDPLEYADVLSHMSSARFSRGDLEGAAELGLEVASLLDQFGYSLLFFKMCSPLILSLVGLGRAREALRLVEEKKRRIRILMDPGMAERLLKAVIYAGLGERGEVEKLCVRDAGVCGPGVFIGGEECLAWRMVWAWLEGRCSDLSMYTGDSLGLRAVAERLASTCRSVG